jgi:hypothetical protein
MYGREWSPILKASYHPNVPPQISYSIPEMVFRVINNNNVPVIK